MKGKRVDAETNTTAKKSYQRPTLRAYGSIEDITKTGGFGGMMTDNRGPGMVDSRTH